ncbi:unnamed protein product [Nezara viridula]|uniref:Uncharacterized protein n=1 Tax=Nezara viridula TaxID=85310 RepID=A0A9P0H641_NEZVI|nr:unnamed protein product [Nezara viridula]
MEGVDQDVGSRIRKAQKIIAALASVEIPINQERDQASRLQDKCYVGSALRLGKLPSRPAKMWTALRNVVKDFREGYAQHQTDLVWSQGASWRLKRMADLGLCPT